ncbi:TPA: hypothetical protein ACH3X1_012596 [Trebouxia sp. C0004]
MSTAHPQKDGRLHIAVVAACMQSGRETNLRISNPKRLVQVSLTQDLNCQALNRNMYARQCIGSDLWQSNARTKPDMSIFDLVPYLQIRHWHEQYTCIMSAQKLCSAATLPSAH